MSRGIVEADPPRPATARRLAAGIALLVVVVGIPLWLVRYGGSPWTHLDPRAMWAGFGVHRSVDPGRVVGWVGHVALAVAWVAWGWSVVCLVVELRAWASGRAAARLPASRSLQWVAALLIGTTFAVGSVGRVPDPARAVAPAPSSSAVSAPIGRGTGSADGDTSTWSPAAGGPVDGDPFLGTTAGRKSVRAREDALLRPSGSPARASDRPFDGTASPVGPAHLPAFHTVTSRETLWSIAESRLGSARRWPEIAALNYGRPQADGRTLDGDHWVRTGWRLELPEAVDTTPIERPDEAVGSPGSGQPGHVVGGQAPPDVPGPQGASVTHLQASPVLAAVGDAVLLTGDPGGPSESHRPGPGLPTPPATPLGAGVVGAGLAGMVDRLRRVQQRHRGDGSRIRMPGPELRAFEQRVRCGDGADTLRSAESAVRMLHDPDAGHGGMGAAAPPIVGIIVGEDLVRIVLAAGHGPDRDVNETTMADGSPVLTVTRTELARWAADHAGIRRAYPVPTLVTVGRGADGSVVMVHPEGVGALVVRGEQPEVDGVARALALELATSRWSGQFELVLVGFGVELAGFDHVSSVDDVDALTTDLIRRRLRVESRLAERNLESATAARCTDPGGGWEPLVVICGPRVPVEDAQSLLELGGDGRSGIAVVAVASRGSGPLGRARTVLTGPDRNGALLEYLGQLVEPQRIDPEDVADARALLDAAGIDARAPVADGILEGSAGRSGEAGTVAFVGRDPSPAVRSPVEPEVPRGPTPTVVAGVADHPPPLPAEPTYPAYRSSAGTSPTTEVEVRVLGPVDVLGAARTFTRAWALELVVYLAVHPQGASNETWATALWPDRVMAPSSLHSTVSVARRALGTSRGGDDHLPRSHGRLRLASSVGTDWGRFLELSRTNDVDQWRGALELVRGRPFEGLRSADWSILDGTAPAIESAVVDLSGRLSGACLRTGDARGAEWAARRGLLVSPYDERLYRMLMRAADAAGNPGGVESAMSELMRVVADEIEPVESVHPSTLALYRSLTRRRIPVA